MYFLLPFYVISLNAEKACLVPTINSLCFSNAGLGKLFVRVSETFCGPAHFNRSRQSHLRRHSCFKRTKTLLFFSFVNWQDDSLNTLQICSQLTRWTAMQSSLHILSYACTDTGATGTGHAFHILITWLPNEKLKRRVLPRYATARLLF